MLFSQDTALEPQLTLGHDEGGERVEYLWAGEAGLHAV